MKETMNQRTQAKQETTRKIRKAASELFDEQGFDNATIRGIANRAKVSVGAVMAVGKKDELLVQIFDDLLADQHDAADQHRQPQAKTVMDVLLPFIRIFDEHGDLARIYASILISGQHQSQVFADLRERLLSDLTAVISSDHSIDAEGADELASAVYHGYLGVLFGFVAAGGRQAHEVVPQLRATVEAIYPGVQNRERGE